MSTASYPPSSREPPPDFAESFTEEMPSLIGFVIRLGTDPDEARDIAQQAFINAVPRWSLIENPRAYLRTVANREYIRRRRLTAPEMIMAEVPAMTAPPDPAMMKIEFRDQEMRIFDAIRRLPTRQREVIAWTIDGFEPDEIARMLGVSNGAVRGSLFKARRALRQALNISQGGARND